ncbi:acyl-CoA dehydrogenase family protein [Streptomyces sp. NBRC 110611]|uniref:acyl-CoA dehydrogenase family protein n=1 Tax=Streptomyces sp. NBRC 110611 TaxID=1621259 RepID=UPI00083003C2|nr:acyl-CoA dehydrogenase family protein [Streptomyces sp. NBRC 110611]
MSVPRSLLVELDSSDFLDNFQRSIDEFDSARLPQEPLSREALRKLVDLGIYLPAIPREYGGRESHREMCEIIEIMSERNLPLGMYTMIVTVLFLRNVAASGDDALKKEVFDDFATHPVIGGLAFTEPSSGSNLARMQTTYHDEGDAYRITGTKHWQAFSEQADWWIICARHPERKEFGYFAHKRSDGGFVTTEVYDSLGLKNLGYGLNTLDLRVPRHYRLTKARESLGDAAEILCGSRYSKAAMASGFLRRLHTEALRQVTTRKIGDGTLHDIDYVRYKVTRVKQNYVVCNALYRQLMLGENYYADLEDSMFASLATKVLASELMLESALDYQQLCGGEGYRTGAPDNIAAYALLDARVYTVFDGTNDLLCQHLAHLFLRRFQQSGLRSPLEFTGQFGYLEDAFFHLTDINLSYIADAPSQDRIVILGRILSRMYGISMLQKSSRSAAPHARLAVDDADYPKAIALLKNEIVGLLNEYELAGRLAGTQEVSDAVRPRPAVTSADSGAGTHS